MPRRPPAYAAYLPALLHLLLQLALITGSHAAPHPDRPRALEPGDVISATHRTDDTLRYESAVVAGHVYLLELTQRGADLAVSVEMPGLDERTFNSPLHRKDGEAILMEIERSGRLSITVSSEEFTETTVGHSIRVRDVSTLADESNELELLAWQSMTSGAEANALGGELNWRRAIADYRQAAVTWREIGAIDLEARANFSIAMILYWGLSDYDGVIEPADAATRLYRSVGIDALAVDANRLRATAMMEIAVLGDAEKERGNIDQSTALLNDAIAILSDTRTFHAAAGNVFDVGQITNNIGLAYYYMGDWNRAERYWIEAVSFFDSLGERSAELLSLNNLALIDFWKGNFRQAIQK